MGAMNPWMTFPSLDLLQGFRHRFILRHSSLGMDKDRDAVIRSLTDWHLDHVAALGFERKNLQTAEQIHGTRVALIHSTSRLEKSEGCDGLVTDVKGVMLGIYVADCCAVYLVDPVRGVCGLVHSGKRGTEGRITSKAVHLMVTCFASNPADIVVQLSPCIRPPAYETDFAASIRQEALDVGINSENIHDTGICTSSDLTKFYSYRMEKGRTGRMLALIGKCS